MPPKQELKPDDPKFLPAQYDLTAAQLTKLRKEYDPANIPTALEKGDEGYQAIHSMVMNITKVRTNIDKVRKGLKADALAWGKKVDGEAKRLTEIVVSLEEPWRKIKTDLEEKEEREKQAAREAEEKAIAIIEERIAGIKSLTEGLLGATADQILARNYEASSVEITEELFGDYVEAATIIRKTVMETLTNAHAERLEFEEQQAAAAKQQAEMAEQQAKLDAQAAEQAKAQRELDDQKAAQEAAEKAEQARKEKEEREAQEEIERQEREQAEAEAKKKRKAELAKRLPEDRKVRDYADALMAVQAPGVESKELGDLVMTALVKVKEIQKLIYLSTQEKK